MSDSTNYKVILLLSILLLSNMVDIVVQSAPTWPTTWIQIDWDKNENGPSDDWRDVEYAYANYDANYLYLKQECYGIPGSNWPTKDSRHKWFIDFEGNLYKSGGNVRDAEYLLFVEDTDNDGTGEIYLIHDDNNDNYFSEVEPWPPATPSTYEITDTNVAGWRIVGNQMEMYISFSALGDPASIWVAWVTDQENPNVDQMPTTDHWDEDNPFTLRDVAALSQTPDQTTVAQGTTVQITVVVKNLGIQTETFDVTCYFDSTPIGTQTVTNLAPGATTNLYFNWDTTGIPPGTYTIDAWADSASAIIEIDELNNWCPTPASVTIQVHDVAATYQESNATSVEQGEWVEITATICNWGDYTETFDVTCYYDGTVIDTKTVIGLLAGHCTSLTFDWNTVGVPAGTYYIKVFADSPRAITEINENNNNCTQLATVTVYIPGEPGDIEVDKALYGKSGPDPPEVGRLTTYTITVTVSNPGGSNVNNVKVTDFITSESDVTYFGYTPPSQGTVSYIYPPTSTKPELFWNVGTLTPGQSETFDFIVRLTPTSTGLKYLNYAADLTANGTEAYAGGFVTDVGDTDITDTAVIRNLRALSQGPTQTVNQGQIAPINVVVRNDGDYYSETFQVTCYYDGTPIGTQTVYNLPPATSTTLTFNWNTAGVTPGIYDIDALVDSTYAIIENNEGDNYCEVKATVTVELHDVAAMSQAPDPADVEQGETTMISVYVENQGSETETFNVNCYYSDGVTETLIGTQGVTLNPGEGTTLVFPWDTTGVPPGHYYIIAKAAQVTGEIELEDNICEDEASVFIIEIAGPKAVGGEVFQIDKIALLAPWLNIIVLILAAASILYLKYRKMK